MKCRKQGYRKRLLRELAGIMADTWSFPQLNSHMMTWRVNEGVATVCHSADDVHHGFISQ
jgi:hypothetical protein